MKFERHIVPHLWFSTEALDAADFYCSLFPNSKINSKYVIHDTPSGECDIVSFELWGQPFEAISAGPHFEINPSISIMVNFDPVFFRDEENPEDAGREMLNTIWHKLIDGGEAFMEIGSYDFSPRYGWVKDKFGMTWQLILTDPGGDPRPPMMLSLLFVGDACGKAGEAGSFYRSLFSNSDTGLTVPYSAGMEPDRERTTMFSDFKLGKSWITAADSAYDHQFCFNEAVSLILYCNNQDEIDYLTKKLSAVPDSEQCGWVKDRYGISWQIVPEAYVQMMRHGNEKQIQSMNISLLGMKKIDIAELQSAFYRVNNE